MGETHEYRNFKQESRFHIHRTLLLHNSFPFISRIGAAVYLQQHPSVCNSTISHVNSGLVISIPEATTTQTPSLIVSATEQVQDPTPLFLAGFCTPRPAPIGTRLSSYATSHLN